MAARATWKGYLKVSLVNIPIKVFPATESSGTISFNQLHAECQTRIQQKRWCPSCNKEVANTELVKGFEFEKGRYVVMSEEDIEKVRPSSTRVIDLVQFDDADALDPMYVDRSYYLAPDGQVAADAFAVFKEGMKGKIGIGKLALYGREYLVGVKPVLDKDSKFVTQTLAPVVPAGMVPDPAATPIMQIKVKYDDPKMVGKEEDWIDSDKFVEYELKPDIEEDVKMLVIQQQGIYDQMLLRRLFERVTALRNAAEAIPIARKKMIDALTKLAE